MRSSMDEKLYKKIKSIGAGNIVFGIISVVCGVTTGVLLIVNVQDFWHINPTHYFKRIRKVWALCEK